MNKTEYAYIPPKIIVLELSREDIITASETGESNKQQDAQPDFFSFFK